MTFRTLPKYSKRQPGKQLISGLIDRVGALRLLLILYALFVVSQMLVNGYCKHLETYDDEWIYYGMAQSLAKGMGFPAIYGDAFTNHTRYLYSLLIAPGLLVSSRLLQFRLIAMLNALMIGSGAFPIYLLAKRVLKEDRLALLAGLIYLVLPDMEFTATFMTENLWLPVALWTIWLFYRLVIDGQMPDRRRIITTILLFVFAAALVNIKGAGITIVIALAIYFVLFRAFQFVQDRRGDEKKTRKLVWGILVAVLLALAFALVNQYQDISKRITGVVSTISTHAATEPARYAWCYVYTWATEILALGVFPVILPSLSFRRLSPSARRLFVLILLLTFVANIGVANTSLSTTEVAHMTDFRLHQRYVAYLWALYTIPFLDAICHESRSHLVLSGLCVAATLAFCVAFRGAIIGSTVDTSLLYWATNWMTHRKLWVALVVLFVGVGLLLLWLGYKRAFRLLFFGVMLVVVVYDHRAMHDLIKVVYGFEYTGIEDTERFIKDNPTSTFLVVTLPNKVDYNDVEVHYNAKVADTFLVYPNSIFASGKKVEGIQTDQGIDLSEVGMDDTGISIIGPRKIESVDYVVLTNEMSIDESMCEKVAEDGYFSIYRLDDNTKIPYMQNFNNWYLPGKTTLQPEAGFSSNYYEGDDMVFVSGKNPAYVLYGPGISLQPGRYAVTVNYSYEGNVEGKIGSMGLVGSTLDTAKYQADVYANRDSVSISFDLLDQCDAFEVRLFADVAGIKVEAIDVEMLALKQVEVSGYVVHQFRNASNTLVRDEYYTLSGERVINANGYYAVDYCYVYGNMAAVAFFDVKDRPIVTTDGWAVLRYTYNEWRQAIRQERFGTAGEPVSPGGCQMVEYERDERGNAIECRYFDVQGNRVVLPTGAAMVHGAYNASRQLVRQEFYNIEYEPTMHKNGFFAVEYTYDEAGNATEERYYGLDGEPVIATYGYAILRNEFDMSGHIIRKAYYGTKNEPITVSGVHAITYVRDQAGLVIEERYYGIDQKVQDNDAGIARVVRMYDASGKLEEKYYDANGSEVVAV